ncbi:MAG: hypothetical protein KC708_11045, partial [Anaerolineae bacterium]|nr:hypothetical protein [Anaerolineae bacterium]
MIRQITQKLQKPFLLAITLFILCLPAIQPFLLGKMPLTDDGNLHLYRIIALDHSMTFDSTLWPRYSSVLALGYGAPLFNYFPPTTYYIPRFLHLLGIPFIQTYLISMALYTYIAAWGTFLLGRSWSNTAGGLITSAAYIYAPYWLFNTITRGTLNEVAGLAILPFSLWTIHNLARMPNAKHFVTATLTTALLIVIHNIVALHGAMLLAAYSLFLIMRSNHIMRTFWILTSVALLSVAISAFFWLPALAETGYTHIPGTTEALNFIDPVRTLRSLADVFALPKTADPSLLNPEVPISLGWPQTVLGVFSLLLALKVRHRRGIVLFLSLVLLASIFLNLEVSAPLWNILPLIGYSQFAWRILGISTLVLALLGGLAVEQITSLIKFQWLTHGFIAISLGCILILSIPWLYTPYIDIKADSIVDVLQYENQRRELSLSSYSEYLPAWTDGTSLDAADNITKFQENNVISRLLVPDTIEVIRVAWQSLSVDLDLDASRPSELIFQWLYMPGWVAYLDSEVIDITPTLPEGFIQITVPEGRHTLQIALEVTLLQATAWGISGIGSVLLILIFLIWNRSTTILTMRSEFDGSDTDSMTVFVAVAITSISVLIFKNFVIDQTQNIFRSNRLAAVSETSSLIALNGNFNGEIRLLGITPLEATQSGTIASFELFWELNQGKLDGNYQSFIQLVDINQNVVLQTEPHPPGNQETTNWLPNLYVQDSIDLAIP